MLNENFLPRKAVLGSPETFKKREAEVAAILGTAKSPAPTKYKPEGDPEKLKAHLEATRKKLYGSEHPFNQKN